MTVAQRPSDIAVFRNSALEHEVVPPVESPFHGDRGTLGSLWPVVEAPRNMILLLSLDVGPRPPRVQTEVFHFLLVLDMVHDFSPTTRASDAQEVRCLSRRRTGKQQFRWHPDIRTVAGEMSVEVQRWGSLS